MAGVTVRCVHDDIVPAVLEADGCVYYQAFGTANAEVGVDEEDALFPKGLGGFLGHGCG